MTPFEEELRKALARREPDGNFTARILAQTAAEKRPGIRDRLFGPASVSWRFASFAALLLLLASGLTYRQHSRTVEGEAAKKQLLIAMQIAGSQLHQAQLRVKRIEFPEVVMQ
ncbi:MAG: hypothetical protein M3Y72_07655 [Acidobacteriota bacterium]|nr:hypothetical protein [Acidobacteriota bacterium]